MSAYGIENNLVTYVLWALPFLAVPVILAMLDFVVFLRTHLAPIHGLHKKVIPNEDFTILVPIFGDLKYLKNVPFLQKYPGKVVLCTTDKESTIFNKEIQAVADEHNFRIFRSAVRVASKGHRPNPWSLFRKTLEHKTDRRILTEAARDEIIRDSFSAVKSKYCIFIDADTVAISSLQLLAGLMKEKDYDIASLRVLASKENTLMEKLQAIEYRVSMDARLVYPWLTSGAAMIAKTEVIMDIMSHHSLFFSGGDIEIGKLARILDYKVGHLRFRFLTDVPETFKSWFKQRMAWCGGGFRHAIINMHKFTWKQPFFFFYTTIIVYGLTPFRWYAAVRYPIVIPLVIMLYWVILLIFHWRDWKWFYFLFPFYALIQVMVIVPLGMYTYFRMVYNQKNIGFIRLRPQHTLKKTEA